MKKVDSNDSLLLGWPTRLDSNKKKKPIYLANDLTKYKEKDLSYAIRYEKDGHLISFAPTGSGKGVSVIIPNLLHYHGPTIVIDPKGENFYVTARYRQSLGHRILLLDPFHAIEDSFLLQNEVTRMSLNPLELCQLSNSSIHNDAQMIADLLAGNGSFSGDPYWDISARNVLSGLIVHEMSKAVREERKPRFDQIIENLYAADPIYRMSVMLDVEKPDKFVTRTIGSSFLSITDKTRDGILSTAQSYLSTMMSGDLINYLNVSTISLREIQDREDYTLYIVIPPNKLQSHSFLLKTWVGVLMHAIMERKKLPDKRTLFILDECANLGELDVLRKAVTLLRGYGLQVWMFFQDLSQMQLLYPDYRTMINNCGVFQTFGISRKSAADPLSRIIGTYKDTEIIGLDKTQQILSIAHSGVRTAGLIKYYKSEGFLGRYDKNPLIKTRSNKNLKAILPLGVLAPRTFQTDK